MKSQPKRNARTTRRVALTLLGTILCLATSFALLTSSAQAQDFTLTVSPSSVTLPQGGSVNITVTVTVTNATFTSASLGVSGAPGGVTASLASTSFGGNSTLTLSAANTATTGGATLSVTANDSATGTVTQNVSLNVVPNPVPFIDSVSPLTAEPGSGGFPVTVYGGGFINGYSQIMWTPLSPPSPSVALSNVTCTASECSGTAPASLTQGTAAVTVVNAGRPVSNVFLLPIIGSAPAVGYTPANSATCTTPCQNSPVGAGNGPSSVAVADFNGDGILDLAVTNKNDNTVSILLGHGNGTFTAQAKSPFATGLTPVSVAVGDFNNNGVLDLAIVNACGSDLTCSSKGTVSILLGNGDGSFTAAAASPSTDYTPTYVAVADFDGDGNLDLAVANSCGGTNQSSCAQNPTNGDVTVLLGDGTGNFTLKSTNGTDPNPTWVAVGDFENNGTLDLVTANAGTPSARGTTLTVMIGKGDGTFSTKSVPSQGISPTSVAVGDFNGDGILDLAVANSCGTDTSCSSAGKVAVLEGDGSGGFSTLLSNTAAGTGPSALVVADLNGDGDLDVAVADATGSTVSILLGNGSGGLTLQSTPASPTTGSTPVGIGVGDFNGDGGLDLVTANSNSANASILLAAPAVILTCGANQAAGTSCSVPIPPKTGPPTLAFGSEPSGGTLGAMTVTVTNNSNLQLTITELAVTSGQAYFYLDPTTTTCGTVPSPPAPPAVPTYKPFTPPYPTVAAGSSCTIGVDFDPQTPGNFTGVVQITDNGAASPQSFSLQGTGAAAAANLSPTTVTFGNVSTNTTSADQPVTLSNTGTATLNISSIVVTSPFVYDTGASNCGTTLNGGSSCTIEVAFSPTAPGSQTGTLTVMDNAGVGQPTLTQTTSLSGTGLQAVANLTPGSLTFNNQLLGTSSVAQPVQLSNTGGGALSISTGGITITGSNAGEFSQTNDCGTGVPGYGNCTIYVTFTPTGAATSATQGPATLSVTGNAGTQTVILTGTEAYPVAAVTGPLSFTQTYGSTSTAQTVTLSNTGNYALNISSISLGGPNANQFNETTTCLASLPAGTPCTISITYTASSIAPASATLTITDNSNEISGSIQTVSLTGTANKSSTLTTITSNTPNPSIVGLPVTVSFTVAAVAPGAGTPTGTVTITDGTDSCTGTLVAGEGSCSITFSFGSVGVKALTATYSGDADFLTSTAGGSQTVIKANTSTTITSNTPNPSIVGLPVTVTFTVTPNAPGVGTPTGTVAVSDGTGGTCTGTLLAGKGTCTMTPMSPSSPGAKAVIATYSGDANFNTSVSPAAAQTVTKANTTTTISLISPNSVVVGQPVTVSFSVAPPAGDILTPTGTVTVTDGVGDSCSAALSPTAPDVGIGSCTFKPSAPGPLTITASYPGDSNFNASSATASGNSALKVGDFGFTVGPPTETISSGHTATYTVTVTSLGGFSGKIALSCSDPAPQTTCSVSPASVTVGGTITSTITVVASKAASHGSWTLTFTGVYGSGNPLTGGLMHTTSAYLVIK